MEQAIGSSQEPGTDWMTMFDSLTPEESSLAFVPARRGSIIAGGFGQFLFEGGMRMEGWERTCVPACVDNADA